MSQEGAKILSLQMRSVPTSLLLEVIGTLWKSPTCQSYFPVKPGVSVWQSRGLRGHDLFSSLKQQEPRSAPLLPGVFPPRQISFLAQISLLQHSHHKKALTTPGADVASYTAKSAGAGMHHP